jgi:disulfide bond formation protein DsbB
MTGFTHARSLAFLLPLALLAGAYGSQYVGGLYPCEMCWWQRYPYFVALAFAAGALALRKPGLSRLFTALAALAILTSAAIGGYHAGVEYGWWEGLTACTATIKGSGKELLDSIMKAPLVRCDAAPWTMFGISLAGYNFLLSGLGGIAILTALWRDKTA